MRHYLNLVDFSVDEEVRIELFLSNTLWKVPCPELSNSQIGTRGLHSRVTHNNRH